MSTESKPESSFLENKNLMERNINISISSVKSYPNIRKSSPIARPAE
jgi:hypothetical protein